MRKFFIIMMMCCTLLAVFVSCQKMQFPSVPTEYQSYLQTFDADKNGYNVSVQAIEKEKKLLESYHKCLEQQKQCRQRVEIVTIQRAVSSFVMNRSAYYNRVINSNTIREKAEGADEEYVYMLYLSDGTIVKSSPRDNPQWLGTKVGETVQKITALQPVQHDNVFKLDSITEYCPLYK